MQRHGRLGLLVAVVVLAVAACGCGGGGKPGDDAAQIGELKGKSLGVASLDGVPSLELRYLLQSVGGLKASTQGGDVTFVEAPGDSLPEMLDKGSVYAAVLPPQVAFGLLEKSSYRVLDHVSRDVGDIAGTPVLSTVLLTYRDEANGNPDALADTAQILKESGAYFRVNQKAVLRSIVQRQGLDKAYVDWQSTRQRTVFGDSSQQVQKGLIDVWWAAVRLGDITVSPSLTEALFNSDRAPRGPGTGRERTTISIAVLDDATRRGALYAIEQGLVRSQHVDLDITYLSMSELSEAAGAREYDVVEASPMLVPTARGSRLDLVVLSGGVQDLDSTLLFERAPPSR